MLACVYLVPDPLQNQRICVSVHFSGLEGPVKELRAHRFVA